MKRLFFVITLIFAASPAYAACSGSTPNWTASSWADIQSCHDNARFRAGDTITLAAGTHTANTTIRITRALTLKGAGCTYDSDNVPLTCQTIVKDQLASANLLSVALAADATTRITQIQFQDNGRSSGNPISIYGHDTAGAVDSRTFRFDHNRLIDLNGSGTSLELSTTLHGRVDHNHFELGTDKIAVYLRNPQSWNWADARWAASTGWGGNDFVFIENNNFTRDAGTDQAAVDAFCGARYVARWNTLFNSWFEMHGSESGRCRGTRAVEVYMNTVDYDHTFAYLVNVRSGTLLAWGNTVTDAGSTALIHLSVYRAYANFNAFALSAGSNVWDVNDGGNPQSICGGTSCTISSVSHSGAEHTVTVSPSPRWTNDQWYGYHFKKVGCSDNNRACGGIIIDNTASAITFSTINDSWSVPSLAGSDQFTVNKITHGMDQPCRSGGTMDVGVTVSSLSQSGTTVSVTWPTNHGFNNNDYVDFFDQTPGDYRGTFQIKTGANCTPACRRNTFQYTLPSSPSSAPGFAGYATHKNARWNDQVTDPCYQWLNMNDSVNVSISADYNTLDTRENEHYYNYTASFTGAVGVGSGTRTKRPATCATGVAYWSTDQGGDWDKSNGGMNDGTLDKCTATDTWTNAYYTPATYDPASLRESSNNASPGRVSPR